jgi:hypothetical protein
MNESKRTRRGLYAMSVIALLGAGPFACSDETIHTASTSSGTSAGGATSGTLSAGGSAPASGTMSSVTAGTGGGVAPPDHIVECQGHVYACGDLIDNDGDGLIDSQDPDCLGPCDNTEDSLFGGIPGQAGPPCKVDCYFDQDSGPGNDDCYWDHTCDPNEVASNYYPEPLNGAQCTYAGPDTVIPPTGKTCAELNAVGGQSQACHDYCGPLTPNGCDCFGCCELPAGTGHFVWLGSEGQNSPCTLDKVTDDTACHPCVPVADCLNPCDPCEICIGKPAPDPGCNTSTSTSASTGGGGQLCQIPGAQACGLPGLPACPLGEFCLTGCCVQEPQ